MEKRLQAIVRRLPLRDEEIEWLAEKNRAFIDICEDYADAEAALEHWNTAPPSATVEARKTEYAALTEELAAEIEQLLDAAACPKPGKNKGVDRK